MAVMAAGRIVRKSSTPPRNRASSKRPWPKRQYPTEVGQSVGRPVGAHSPTFRPTNLEERTRGQQRGKAIRPGDLQSRPGTGDARYLGPGSGPALRVVADDRIATYLTNPSVAAERRIEALETSLNLNVQTETLNLARMLIERNRTMLIPQIREMFDDQLREERGIAIAEVTTAERLTDAELDHVREAGNDDRQEGRAGAQDRSGHYRRHHHPYWRSAIDGSVRNNQKRAPWLRPDDGRFSIDVNRSNACARRQGGADHGGATHRNQRHHPAADRGL